MDHSRIGSELVVDTRFDQRVRWSPGERLDHLFERKVDELCDAGRSHHLAIDTEDGGYTYAGLDERANRLARHLARRGVRSGDRVGLLFDQAIDGYTAMLAVFKLNAAYVPLDAGFPKDRVAYICQDAGVRMVVTCTSLLPVLGLTDAAVVAVDEDAAAAAITRELPHRLRPDERGVPVDELAYVIYTSGTTGRPKGVAIRHASICNFVRVAAEVYGYEPDDRVYQGLTIAFDFSVEEIWVPWIVGATLVPRPHGPALVGKELHDFLLARQVTALCCVPTLLATVEEDLPGLRFLLVSGEACPRDLAERWHRPGRRFLNVYGPTEATVTATMELRQPGKPITLGLPLPSYTVMILDPDEPRILARGEMGELGIAGIGLAEGYINNREKTEAVFINDFIGIPNNPSGRIYRTGDLCRINEHGEIEYHGRIDLQVKIRGYRIELTEIESVLMQHPGIATAVVEPYRPEPDIVHLAAYYVPRSDTAAIDPAQVHQLLRDRLPSYMVPSYLTELEKMPMLPSDKVDRKKLPAPDPSSRLGAVGQCVAPEGPLEEQLARILAGVMGMDRVGVTSHFFDDLGGDSLMMARFCARVRECPDLGHPVMQDVYRHPTIRDLATALEESAPAGAVPTGAPVEAPPRAHRVSTAQYVALGAAQALTFAALASLSAFVFILLFDWLTEAPDWSRALVRSVGMAAAMLVFLSILPVVAKWVLVGRITDQQLPVWGLGYYRFWVVRLLLGLSPARLAAGTPVLIWYLRLLGARIGANTVIQATTIPACPDLLSIGSNVVVCPGTVFNCYRVDSGVLRSGPVTIGDRAFVGGHGVLDIDTAIGQDAQLAHSSSLAPGQRVPAGQCWHGTPAVPGGDDHRTVPELAAPPWRGIVFGLWVILVPVLLSAPLFTIIWILLHAFPVIGDPLMGGEHLPWGAFPYNVLILGATVVLVPVGLFTGMLWVYTVPRLINKLLTPGRVYPLYGVRYIALRMASRMTNTPYIWLLGDSSYITGFLSLLGYQLKPVIQTGTNFGLQSHHDIPYLVRVGTGTMVSDGIIFMNAEYSSTAFRVRPAVLGERNYVGTNVVVTPEARIGDNVLLATKVLVPTSGELRHDVGLLGSPAFEIPRSVQRDTALKVVTSGPDFDRALRAKLRYNTGSIVWRLQSYWFIGVVAGTLSLGSIDLHHQFGSWPLALSLLLLPLISALYYSFLEWAAMGFRRMRPRYTSAYDPYYWRHERFWKMHSETVSRLLSGTPFKPWLMRIQGIKVGRQLFDDGGYAVERTMVTVGDYCTINAGSVLQGHSLEEGIFKSDHIVVEDGVTIGPRAFVHYGTRLGAGSLIDTDAFLMKGEEVPPGQWWHGNPARPAQALAPAPGPSCVSMPAGPEPTTAQESRDAVES